MLNKGTLRKCWNASHHRLYGCKIMSTQRWGKSGKSFSKWNFPLKSWHLSHVCEWMCGGRSGEREEEGWEDGEIDKFDDSTERRHHQSFTDILWCFRYFVNVHTENYNLLSIFSLLKNCDEENLHLTDNNGKTGSWIHKMRCFMYLMIIHRRNELSSSFSMQSTKLFCSWWTFSLIEFI